jgi:molybdate transport system substrate-binding protein
LNTSVAKIDVGPPFRACTKVKHKAVQRVGISLMSILRSAALTIITIVFAATPALAQPLRVAAASDLQAALPGIAAQFEKDTGHTVSLTFGSSGNFFTQLQNGAPFDVFLSADIDYPRQLERDGQAERGSLYAYATGRIVLWTRNDSKIDVKRGLAALADAGVRKIAIANPEHAPYGRAAVAALHHAGIYDRVQSKLVRGENISQAAQFVQSGNAEVGIVALSLALAPALENSGRYVEIPESFYPPIEQAAVVVATSRQKPVARQFVQFLTQPASVRALQSFGFVVTQRAR